MTLRNKLKRASARIQQRRKSGRRLPCVIWKSYLNLQQRDQERQVIKQKEQEQEQEHEQRQEQEQEQGKKERLQVL